MPTPNEQFLECRRNTAREAPVLVMALVDGQVTVATIPSRLAISMKHATVLYSAADSGEARVKAARFMDSFARAFRGYPVETPSHPIPEGLMH